MQAISGADFSQREQPGEKLLQKKTKPKQKQPKKTPKATLVAADTFKNMAVTVNSSKKYNKHRQEMGEGFSKKE